METKSDCSKCPVGPLVDKLKQLKRQPRTVSLPHRGRPTEEQNEAAFPVILTKTRIMGTEQQIEVTQKKCGRTDCPHKK